MAKEKKEVVKKETRKAIEPTGDNLKRVIDQCRVLDVSLPAIKKLLDCTWKEAVTLRHAAVKQLKAK